MIHLIDDGTPGGADEVLRYWGSHPRVRTYRNVRNIGQFLSFNNVAPYFETRLVAIQDADDVSHPHRLRLSGNLLRLADAEIFAGSLHRFHDQPDLLGDRSGRRPAMGRVLGQQPPATRRRLLPPEYVGDHAGRHVRRCYEASAITATSIATNAGSTPNSTHGPITPGPASPSPAKSWADYRVHAGSATNNSVSGWNAPQGSSRRPRTSAALPTFKEVHSIPVSSAHSGALEGLTERVKFC